MNQKLLILLGIGILTTLSIGGLFFLNYSQDNNSNKVIINADNKSAEKDNATKNISSYIEYSRENLDNSIPGKRVLFFYASWCPTCRPADENFKSNTDKIPGDLTLIRVNYNDPDTDREEKDLAKKYNVTYQHTFVQIDENGNEITKWNGGQINEVLKNIK